MTTQILPESFDLAGGNRGFTWIWKEKKIRLNLTFQRLIIKKQLPNLNLQSATHSYTHTHALWTAAAGTVQTHLRDGAVLLHQQGGVVVDGLGLRLVPAQATQQAGEEASAAGLLSRGAGRRACSGGAERDYNSAGQLFDRSGRNGCQHWTGREQEQMNGAFWGPTSEEIIHNEMWRTHIVKYQLTTTKSVSLKRHSIYLQIQMNL